MMLLAALCALLVPVAPAFGAGLIIVDEAHWWPGPIPPGPIPPPWPPRPIPPPRPHAFCPLEFTSVKVHTRINDQVAVTAIDQEFYNPNNARLEGTFLFPIPKGAHLDKFTMDIDGKQVQAELLKADKARGIYEDIVRKLKDPALLEYAGQDAFKVRIFPIEPHSKKRVTFSYTQLLQADDGLVGYLLPLNTEKFSAKPLKNVSIQIELETRRPLKSVYSPTHTVEVKRHGDLRATVGFEASNTQPDTDFALYFSQEKDEIGLNLLTHRDSDKDGYFLLLASPGLDVKGARVIPKDVVFVLDTSGSMAGKKLEQAKKALQFCIENLNDTDRFEIVRFSTEVEPLFDNLAAADRKNRDKAEEFVKDLRPIGGTAIDDALKKALALSPSDAAKGRVFVIIFLTDGRPTIGTTDEAQILADVKKANDSHTRIFNFGIGTDVNTHLLDKITEETRAFSQYVLPEEDIEVKVSSFFAKIKEPVLANPTLKFTGDIRVTKLYPAPLPDLFKGEQLVVVGRFSGHGDSAVVLEGTVNGTTKKLTYEVKFPEETAENEFIPRLWATRRIGYLLDEIRLHGENSELRDEVTSLARQYGIVTPYTAYLIVEDETRRNVPQAVRSIQNFDRDPAARAEASRSWTDFQNNRSGDMAVADAMSGLAMKQAVNAPSAAAEGNVMFMRRYGMAAGGTAGRPAKPAESDRLVQYSQQAQFVAGKNFFQNDRQWIDAAVQQNQDLSRIRIQFGSAEYFKLAAAEPKARQWLALGQNVQFVLNNRIYDIYE